MNTNSLELVFILDRSGSMSGLEHDTIGGFNGMIQKQRALEGDVRVSTVLFDDRFEVLHDRQRIETVAPLTTREYYVRGSTALLDAIGRSIRHIRKVRDKQSAAERMSKVLFVITTDGMENASSEFSADYVKLLVERMQEKEQWEFLFLGANIDAIATAERMGIRAARTANYHADKRGIQKHYESVSDAIMELRVSASIQDDWKEEVEKDFKDRK
jgi:uncharacterized protein YegL